jgi:hypothetical protein
MGEAMELPAALPLVEASMQRPGIAKHLASVADWLEQGQGACTSSLPSVWMLKEIRARRRQRRWNSDNG